MVHPAYPRLPASARPRVRETMSNLIALTRARAPSLPPTLRPAKSTDESYASAVTQFIRAQRAAALTTKPGTGANANTEVDRFPKIGIVSRYQACQMQMQFKIM